LDKIVIKTMTGVHIIEHQELITYVQPQALYELLIHNLNVRHVHKHSHADTHKDLIFYFLGCTWFCCHLFIVSSWSV